MSKNKSKSSGIPVSAMYAFGRGCSMPLESGKDSPYIQVSKRLDKLGHQRNDGESHRSHCKRLVDLIKETASGFNKKGATSKKTKPLGKPTTTRAPTEQSVKAYIERHSTIDPASDGFLSSFEWKAVRMMALKKYGPVCQCCGASPETGAVMNVDHIKPRKIFPQLALDVDNLQVLCGDCNTGKGNWDMTDWRGHATQSQPI